MTLWLSLRLCLLDLGLRVLLGLHLMKDVEAQ